MTDPAGPNIVLLNDCRDQVNFGAIALVDGLIRIIVEKIPNATIQPIPSHWLLDTTFWETAFVNKGAEMRQPRAAYPSVADQFEGIADDWLRGDGGPGAYHLLSRFEAADLVILNGEGSVYRTNLSAVRELFLAWLCKARLGIPTIFVNGTVHLTDVMPILPAMVRKTFATLDAVAVREPCSLRNVGPYAPGVDVQMVADSAFAFTQDDARRTALSDVIRDHVGHAPYFCFDPGPMPMDARPGQKSALHQLITELKRVVPKAVLIRNNPPDAYIAAVAEETGSLYIDTIVDYRHWMTVVRDAQFLVSGRYHNTILAAIMGCPTVTLGSTSHKVHGACELLDHVVGVPHDGTDLLSEIPSITEEARRCVAQRDELRDRLLGVCERRRAEVAALGDLADKVLRSSSRQTVLG